MRAGREESGRARSPWKVFLVLGALLVGIAWARAAFAGPEVVYGGDFEFYPEPPDSSVVVTPPFELTGRASSVEVAVSTDLDNAAAYFHYALIEQRTGRKIEFGHEVAYSHGTAPSDVVDGKGRRHIADQPFWEGSPDGRVRVAGVPPGRYVLRIAPEGQVPVIYGVRVRRGVPATGLYALAFFLLLVPPALATLGRWLGTTRTPPDTEPEEHDGADDFAASEHDDEALTRLA